MPTGETAQTPGSFGEIRDADLLRSYAVEGSEAAFGELVRRHVGLVYAIALRQCGGDAHLAEDVAQRVFTDLARKARTLSGHAVLGGWLYRSTQYAASDLVRAERRRRIREQEAQAMQETNSSPGSPGEADWQQLAPVLDQAIGDLPARDRDAVVLRFVEGRAFADIGATLRLSEDAARMRVERALDRLRGALVRRGIASTSAALGLALAHQAGAAVPAGLAASVTGAALSGVVAGGGATGMTAIFMSMTKSQVGITGALIAVCVAGNLWQQRVQAQFEADFLALILQERPVATILAENVQLEQTASKIAALRKSSAELESLRRRAESMKLSLQEMDLRDARYERVTSAWAYLADNPPAGPVFGEKDVDVPPRATLAFRVGPPRAIWRPDLGGEVLLDVTVDDQGRVRAVTVLHSTVKEYDDTTIDALKRWEFTPAQKGGRAVNARVTVPFRFEAAKPGAPAPAPVQIEKRKWF